MSRGGGTIVLMPGALERGARDALRLSDELADAMQSLSGISLAGLPPASRGRTAQAIAGARSGVRDAALEARGQGAELRLRAALARAADEGGTIAALDVAIKLWDGGKWPREGLGFSTKLAKELADRERKILDAKLNKVLGYDVTEDLKNLKVKPGSSITQTVGRMEKLRRLEKRLERLAPWSKKLIDVKKISPTGPLKALRGVGGAIPTLGDVAGVVINVKKKMSPIEAVARGAKDLAITAAAPAFGGAACAVIAGGSGGTLAAACVPIMSTAFAIGGKMGTDAGLDWEKKQVEKEMAAKRRRREREEALRRHPTGRCEVAEAPQARPRTLR